MPTPGLGMFMSLMLLVALVRTLHLALQAIPLRHLGRRTHACCIFKCLCQLLAVFFALSGDALTCVAVMQGPGDMTARAAWGMLTALVPALLMNVCIVGINQIFDVAIDKARPPGTQGKLHACAPDEPLLCCCVSDGAAVTLSLVPAFTLQRALQLSGAACPCDNCALLYVRDGMREKPYLAWELCCLHVHGGHSCGCDTRSCARTWGTSTPHTPAQVNTRGRRAG